MDRFAACVAGFFSLCSRLRLTIWVTSFGLNALVSTLRFYPILGSPKWFFAFQALAPTLRSALFRLYGPGMIGGPAVHLKIHRSSKDRSSHESAGPRPRLASARAAALFCASGIKGGILPFGGSTISDVRLAFMTLVPESHHSGPPVKDRLVSRC